MNLISFFCATLTLIFITLKLCHVISWPWLLILFPVYFIPVLFVFAFIISIIGIFFVEKNK